MKRIAAELPEYELTGAALPYPFRNTNPEQETDVKDTL